MAPSSKGRDRRAVVEQLRRDQQRKERRRTLVILSACVVVALVIVGAAVIPLLKQHRLTGGSLTSLGADSASAACQPVIKRKATGNQQHKAIGTVIVYAESPPAFGPHWPTPAPFAQKFYTSADRPQVEYLVHNLEHGYTLMWYDDTIARSSDQLAVVKAIANRYDGTKLSDKFIALPWTSKDGKAFPSGTHVALTHWSEGQSPGTVSSQRGVWEYCGKVSGQAVGSFTKAYPYSDSPEPQGA